MNVKISLQGAIDLHFHAHPCLFPRIGDDLDVAAHARQLGLRALLLKSHHESTVSRAYLVRKLVPDLEVVGGIVLNAYVGGFNPTAVEACLRLGGRNVWMPTIDAWHHGVAYDRTGTFDVETGGLNTGEGLKALDDAGRLKPEIVEILELVAKHDAILSTGHLSGGEILPLVREARNRGVQKILITHPLFKVPHLDLESLQALVRLGAIAEFGYCTVSPQWACATIRETKHAIDVIGAARAVLVSGTGQAHNPMPAEALRIFAQGLCEAGIPEEHIYTMICANPAQLLGLQQTHAQPLDVVRPFPTTPVGET